MHTFCALRVELAQLGVLDVRMDGPFDIEDLRAKAQQINDSISELSQQIKAEKRLPTGDEEAELDRLMSDADDVHNHIERAERLEQIKARSSGSKGRRSPAPQPRSADPNPDPDDSPERMRARGRHGFASMGHFLQAVQGASVPGRTQIDQRLLDHMPRMAAADGTYGTTGSGEDGGHTIPPDFRTEITERTRGVAQLLPRTDEMFVSGNSMVLPKDETTEWSTDGVQAYWDGEGDAITPSRIKVGENTIRLNRLTALCIVTEELLEDSVALASYINRKVPRKINWKVNLAIVQGTGVGQPLGLLNSGAKVTVAKESSQAADTVLPENIIKMFARMYSENLPNSVWIMNQDVLPQLLAMQFQGPGTDKAIWPVYLPPNGLADAPFGTLMGRPLLMHEAAKTLGDEGDIIFTDLTQYLTLQKAGGGIRQDTSMHVYFDQNLHAFRFVQRLAGQPWWSAPITPASGSSNTLSSIVTLAARA